VSDGQRSSDNIDRATHSNVG